MTYCNGQTQDLKPGHESQSGLDTKTDGLTDRQSCSDLYFHIIPLMMEAEMVSEKLGFCPQLTRLVAREYFSKTDLIIHNSCYPFKHKKRHKLYSPEVPELGGARNTESGVRSDR
jgi:hypothetical protein